MTELQKVRRYARKVYTGLLRYTHYAHCHSSRAARRALEIAGEKFNIGYGVEGFTLENSGEGVTHINMGEAYATTVCFYRGRFYVGSWGDLVERDSR